MLKTVATSGEGTKDVVEAVGGHLAWLEGSTRGLSRRIRVVSQTLVTLIGERALREVLSGRDEEIAALAQECVARRLTPLEAVTRFLKKGAPQAPKK